MLCHPEAPVVIKNQTPVVYHVSTISLETGTEVYPFEELPSIPQPSPVSFTAPSETATAVELGDASFWPSPTFKDVNEVLYNSVLEMYGYTVLVVSDNDGLVVNRYRCQSNMYTYIKQIIGKQPIKYEIINLIKTQSNGDKSSGLDGLEMWNAKQKLFLTYYPHYSELYTEILNGMNSLGQSLYNLYLSKYVHKQQIKYSHVIHDFLFNNLHKTQYKENKTKITLQLVNDELHKMPNDKYCILYNNWWGTTTTTTTPTPTTATASTST